MRNIISMNENWLFSKDAKEAPQALPTEWEKVNVPHCWNAKDGQDGGNDYYRGTCYYAKSINKADLPVGQQYYIEFRGTNSSAECFVNGKSLAKHDGGYSTWRVNITEELQEENLIVVAVDNAPNDRVYPQMADFTFYGGIYRNVNLIAVSESHFDLDYFGAPGIKVTPKVEGANAEVEVEVYTTGVKEGQQIRFELLDKEGNVVFSTTQSAAETTAKTTLENVHLWNGRKDPYLYGAKATLLDGTEEIDSISTRFGCRSYVIDPEKGFILNGESYPLRGVSRHQDRWGIGNALLPQHHEEDIDLIMELGATTIRLAHYQHDQYFYDLCDEKGLVIWAEIPFISQFMETGYDNTISQMTELVAQNYNHASIVVWGLSNEITMQGASSEELIKNHNDLNDLCHKMDPTRLTTMAVVSMCSQDDPYLQIPDTLSWNHYFGWYGGNASMNGPWLDGFHKKYPQIPVGMSEYGCEALNWHTSNPKQGDYTEEYQAYYHEELIKQLYTRDYLWATHVWNMFDFGADARAEGGENGQNHKGLVTFDRKYKKDSFYAYKAWLSDEPFVHICGKRYVDRVEDTTKVTVYSNQPQVELFVNGTSLGVQESPEHFFYFEVPNVGESTLKAVAGDCTDESHIKKVDEPNEAYILREKGAILNWFDITEPEGYFSLNDTIGDIMATAQGKILMATTMAKIGKMMKGKGKDGAKAGGFEMNQNMMEMMNGFTVIRITNMAATMNLTITKEQLLDFNAKLNKIKKPKQK
jgi:beta-galactosidase